MAELRRLQQERNAEAESSTPEKEPSDEELYQQFLARKAESDTRLPNGFEFSNSDFGLPEDPAERQKLFDSVWNGGSEPRL